MSKYQALRAFLASRKDERIPMTFAEIEKVLGFGLPRSQIYPAWWSNNSSNNVMTNEWLAAGYKTEQVDIEGRKLVFRRTKAVHTKPAEGAVEPPANSRKPRRHPFFGWMKGMITIAPGTDLTQPADPNLAEHLDQKYGRERGRQAS